MKTSQWFRGLALATLLIAGHAIGTAQEPDVLIVDGEPQAIFTNPLTPWLQTHPEALPKDGVIWSSNWRGYIATWEIAAGKLWLRKVDVTYAKETKEDLEQSVRRETAFPGEEEVPTRDHEVRRNVIPRLFPDPRNVVASWYTGTLILPKGKMIEYVHMGYGSSYERYTVIWVRAGDVTRQIDLSGAQFMELRKERFKAWQATDAYRKQLKELSEGGRDREGIDGFLFEFAAEEYLSSDPGAAKD